MEHQYRLIKKTISYVPVGGRLYRHCEILEEVIRIPTIDLTSGESTPIHSNISNNYDRNQSQAHGSSINESSTNLSTESSASF